MTSPQAGRKRFRGEIESYVEGEVRLSIDNPEGGKDKIVVGLPFADIAEAKLVMTDRLIAAASRRQPETALGDGSAWSDETQPIPVTDRRQ
jgi:ribosome maturation factor RimP